MPYADVEARQQVLDRLAAAIDALAQALAALGEAYEQLDEQQADRLEEQLFLPVQRAYGRAQRAYSEFAGRHGFEARLFAMPSAGLPSTGVKGFIDAATEAVARADTELIELQESEIGLEVTDVELRGGVSEVRRLIDGFELRARGFVSAFGR